MPLNPSHIVVDNLDDLYDDFTEFNDDAGSIITKKLLPLLCAKVKKRITKVQVIDSTASDDLVYLASVPKHAMLNNEDYIDLAITDLNTFRNRFPDIDFALFISKVHFLRHVKTTWHASGMGPNSAPVANSEKSLMCVVQYVFWDFANNELVACGKLAEKSGFLFFLSSGNWIDCVKQAGATIGNKNPF